MIVSACTTSTKSSTVEVASDHTQVSASNIHHLSGDTAVLFIKKHFPNAYIPEPAEGVYYIHGKKAGYATCFYPAMGARSMGQVPTCDLK